MITVRFDTRPRCGTILFHPKRASDNEYPLAGTLGSSFLRFPSRQRRACDEGWECHNPNNRLCLIGPADLVSYTTCKDDNCTTNK